MKPYHYSVVRCRDADIAGETRNVGLLVVSAGDRKVWLRRGRLESRAHLIGDDATFVRALLDQLQSEAEEIAREGEATNMFDWLRDRARPTESSIHLSPPAVGIAEDLPAEVARLAQSYLAMGGGGGRSAAEKLQSEILKRHGLQRAFQPRAFESGPAMWRFTCVTDLAEGPLVFNAIQFGQKTPEGVIEAAWANVGRAGEVAHYHPRSRWLTLAMGPSDGRTGRAFSRAVEVMASANLNLVEPSTRGVERALMDLGLVRVPTASAA